VVLARVLPHDSGKVQEIMDRNGAKLARELRELAEQLRFLESKLTSAGITLRMGELYVDGEHVETQTLTELKSALGSHPALGMGSTGGAEWPVWPDSRRGAPGIPHAACQRASPGAA
jgi:hypothetical protein